MSFINASYFFGNLQVAQLNHKSVTDNLQWFIDYYEPEFLSKTLGVELADAFIAGLSEDPIDSKWLFLRDGGNYTGYSGYQKKWTGVAAGSAYNPMIFPSAEIVVPTNGYAGTNTLTYPPLAGAMYWVERRGFGTALEGRDIAITNNRQTWTLLQVGDLFAIDEVWIAHITKAAAGSPSSGNAPSPLAAYVYYHYMRDLQTQTSGIGEVKPYAQNAMMVSANQKMVDAWNIMSRQLENLYEYLNLNNDNLYPQWNYGANSEMIGAPCYWNSFGRINTIGI